MHFLVLRMPSCSLYLVLDSVGGTDTALTYQTQHGTLGGPKAGASVLGENTKSILIS